MENIESLCFYLSKDERKMIIEAGEENNKFIDVVYYLCCDIEDINLNHFINILLNYKELNPGTDCMCCYLINKIAKIVNHICCKRLNTRCGYKNS